LRHGEGRDAIALRPSDDPGFSSTPDHSRRWTRDLRLVRRGEYETVYREGRRRSSQQFVVFFRPNRAACSRFGFSVKKQLGGAVVRNRIRRRIREIVRLNRSEIPAGWDIVIHPRASVARAEFSRLAMELTGLLRSALA
jgi:ribonuclease P protein component